MDGMEVHGTPWLDKPLSLHAYREYECTLNVTSQCEYQQGYWRFWYEADHRYALPTIALFCSAVVLFASVQVFDLFAPQTLRRTTVVRRTIALGRFISYRAFRINALNWNSAPLGILGLGAVGAIYFLTMTLAPKPYYWPNTEDVNYGGSPPIATRSGWLSLACLPFVFATVGKSNFITAVTGISHEKLQVFHRWISYAFFITALVHTFPFIVYNIQTHQMVMNWDMSVYYWTGVVALLAQTYLTFASAGPLRNMSYEWFKATHFIAGLVFVVFLFFHCDHTLSAWDYFIVTGVLFSLSWLHRQVRIYGEHGINKRATVSLASNGFVCVRVPTNSSWRIGQHFFVRFMSFGLHAWSIHPFTVCSLPEFDRSESELVFYIRPRGGFTARLARYAEAHPNSSIRVLLDGPYGGIHHQKIRENRRQLIVAGGSGAGWILPLISAFIRRRDLEKGDKDTKEPLNAKIVLATRDLSTREWFEQTVKELLADAKLERLPEGLEMELYYTGSSTSLDHIENNRPEKSEQFVESNRALGHGSISDTSSLNKTVGITHIDVRPDLPALVRYATEATPSNESLGVFVCGPLSMQNDVSNAVASEQVAVLQGASKDIYLHMEHFSWA